ncbi:MULTISPECIES: phage tail assembly protein [unclassified Crossiella]|uniref:phage tail assembly protein n=1 Tax=unclassified Crossiella TaxID=2620835 RepID=UPI001FFEDE8D|nr:MULTISPECIES: phage tail assembly protein [unclassified Crossiella]MCK2242319.1 phage tail assembly protein [Crossiella sp. S99.2]MCK2254650.1 phage tail assembly protein [Crossiella sp. S99.1]
MTSFTLADLHAEMERQFGDFTYTTEAGPVRLRAVLRLPEADRSKVEQLLSSLDGSTTRTTNDTMAVMRHVLCLCADQPDRLFTELDAQPEAAALVLVLFQRWAEHTQPGEASRSAS